MALFYSISPQEIDGWYHVDYLPRAEAMHVQAEVDAQYKLYQDRKSQRS